MRSTAKSWLWAAEDYATAGGFFERAKVKVVSNASNRGTNIAALAGSGVDVVLGDPGEAMRGKSSGMAIKTFIQTVNKYASNVVIKKSVLEKLGVSEASPVDRKIAALKGLRLGTTGPGAAPDALFRWLAVTGGMNPNSDMRLVTIQGGGPGMLAGLQQDVIDGFAVVPTSDLAGTDPRLRLPVQHGAHSAAVLPELPLHLRLDLRSDSAQCRQARGARSLLPWHLDGAEGDQLRPGETQEWADKWFEGLPPEIAQVSFDINSKIFSPTTTPQPALFASNVDFINTVNKTMNADLIPASLTFEAQFDTALAREGVARG